MCKKLAVMADDDVLMPIFGAPDDLNIYISLGIWGALAVTVGGKQSIRWNCRLYRWDDYDNTTHSNTPN